MHREDREAKRDREKETDRDIERESKRETQRHRPRQRDLQVSGCPISRATCQPVISQETHLSCSIPSGGQCWC